MPLLLSNVPEALAETSRCKSVEQTLRRQSLYNQLHFLCRFGKVGSSSETLPGNGGVPTESGSVIRMKDLWWGPTGDLLLRAQTQEVIFGQHMLNMQV